MKRLSGRTIRRRLPLRSFAMHRPPVCAIPPIEGGLLQDCKHPTAHRLAPVALANDSVPARTSWTDTGGEAIGNSCDNERKAASERLARDGIEASPHPSRPHYFVRTHAPQLVPARQHGRIHLQHLDGVLFS
eukprot:scaffold262175_cov27-Tisochrysis_lutea.AAC.2